MKRVLCFILSLSLILCLNVSFASDKTGNAATGKDSAAALLANVKHLKQSTVRMEANGKVIYFDPVWLDGAPKDADIIFITHTHGDHFSVGDIKNLSKDGTILVVTEDGAAMARKEGIKSIVSVVPNREYSVGGIKFKTVPAYNTNKEFHPKSNKWVGYIVTANSANYYFAGDTDIIPEMKALKVDVAFLPIGGTYTMNVQEAIKAANEIKPKVAVPIHFADVVGTTDDAVAFVSGLDRSIKGVIVKDLLYGVSHLKQSTVRMQANKVIYFDPIGIEGEPKDADVIFITHAHGDHFEIDSLKKLAKSDTIFVLPGDCVKQAVDAGLLNVVAARPSRSYEIEGLKFNTVPAYNIDKDYHKKESNWVGYIVTVNNTSYYFAGDTDKIPEMKDIKANVVFLPVGGTYTMTAKEAAEAANLINPLVAVPIHFADVVGTVEDAKNFINSLNPSIKGVILKKT
jgi:L-ascorbate metabolism protein UlaG (beta-lactamase superfamily)